MQALKEPFFVKNLERVQGDERDAIILTIGYGKTPTGGCSTASARSTTRAASGASTSPSPRARSRMTVVSSFSAADMDPDKLHSDGAQMLCALPRLRRVWGQQPRRCRQGQAGPKSLRTRRRRPAQRRQGSRLVAQYGCSGYWIDFAAQHPSRPGQMVLAIECDGATYHSSATARDRDRLRQEHLERLGWRFHRIWSQEWFHRREAEIDRALDAYQRAVEAADARQDGYRVPASGPNLDPSGVPLRTTGALAASRCNESPPGPRTETPQASRGGPCPVGDRRANIAEYSKAELVSVIRWIESDTLLRTEEQLLEETKRALGFQKLGSRIRDSIQDAIPAARDPNWRPQPPRSASPSNDRHSRNWSGPARQ